MAQAQSEMIQEWINNVVFTGPWWLGVSLSIIPWVIWAIFHKKESRNRLLFAGFGIIIISSFLDFLGVQLGLWVYYYDMMP